MAEAILEIVLENLNSLIQNELPLYCGFDQDMRRLTSLFTTIKATLEDAEEKQFTDKAIKDWLRKLKDAAYILDDILDECAYEALVLEYQGVNCGTPNKVPSSCLSSFHPKHVVFRYKTAKKMKRVSERLDEIAQERIKFHLTERYPERRSGVIDERQTISFIPQVYGRKDESIKIVDFLIGEASHHEELSVYPIIGLGGLGKTTLAQLIFNHESINNHFEKRMWVCVSEDFNLERITKAIIGEATRASCEKLELQSLLRKLQDTLQGKRYLLVLDDVWDYGNWDENWQRLKSVLCCGAKGASILVTTRLSTVATIMGTVSPHKLSELSDDDCWELFKCRAFGRNEVEQVELVDIGKEIVKKCKGVPLAAKALGGLLRFKRNKSEWLNVKESNLLEVSHNQNSIMAVLRLSYLNLPTKLRQCFAYCAIFPKDEVIEKKYLIDLWMANGFISSNERLDYEDVGHDVWNELYWRSFFQNVETYGSGSGKVIRFKMHDLVHDLAQLVAEEVCCITNENDIANLSERIYHLSEHTEEGINLIELHPNQSLRTCILSNRITAHELSLHVLKCYSLRVVRCKYMEELPSKIGSLNHLRYLDLSRGKFKTLPESLCKLWRLQVLILDWCGDLEELPNNLIRLKALQKLSLEGCDSLTSLAPGIGKLTSLRILSKFIVGKERGFHMAELGPLKLKGSLLIWHLERVKSVMDAKEANMSSKKLNELWLSWDSNEESELQENVEQIFEVLQPDIQQLESLYVKRYKGAQFPQWISCSSLKELWIWECRTFNVSAGFQCLEYLEIRGCRDVEGLHVALPHMTALEKLFLDRVPNLESLPDCFGNLPLLRYLYIWGCYKLTCLPTSLSLSNIETLDVYCCSDELKKRCKKESGEDWPKIAHIPHIQGDIVSRHKRVSK